MEEKLYKIDYADFYNNIKRAWKGETRSNLRVGNLFLVNGKIERVSDLGRKASVDQGRQSLPDPGLPILLRETEHALVPIGVNDDPCTQDQEVMDFVTRQKKFFDDDIEGMVIGRTPETALRILKDNGMRPPKKAPPEIEISREDAFVLFMAGLYVVLELVEMIRHLIISSQENGNSELVKNDSQDKNKKE